MPTTGLKGDLSRWIALYKQLDLKRARVGLPPAEEARWMQLKDAIEHVVSTDACPPSSRRRLMRVPTDLEVTFENPAGFRKAYLRNISEGGVYIESDHPFNMGDRFMLTMVVHKPARRIEQHVQVVWVNRTPSEGSGLEPGVGVAFLDLADDVKMAVKAIVHHRLDELAQTIPGEPAGV